MGGLNIDSIKEIWGMNAEHSWEGLKRAFGDYMNKMQGVGKDVMDRINGAIDELSGNDFPETPDDLWNMLRVKLF